MMIRGWWWGAILALAVVTTASRGAAQQGEFQAAKCGINPGHYLVNSGVLYLKSAWETKFPDKKTKDLHDAFRVLDQALRTGGQQKNPAAWYYLGRYYIEVADGAGMDSAFVKAVALAPACVNDVNGWRRTLWVPTLNAGVEAWKAGNTDSAMAALRRANQMYTAEPQGFAYLATMLANSGQTDSAAKYLKLAIQAAQDPKYAKEKKNAMFNLARVYHGAKRWDDAIQAYQDYLAAYPGDVQAIAGLASVYFAVGKGEEAKAQYTQLFQHADSASAEDLFLAGQEILNAVANPPDTAMLGSQCRSTAGHAGKPLTTRQIAVRCDSVTRKASHEFDAGARVDYLLAAQAFETGLAKDPYDREALFHLAGAAALAGDTARALSAAQRAYAVDPLNRNTLRMVAQGWQLKTKADSTLYYLRLADSIPVDVTVTGLTSDEHDATLRGLITNFHPKANPPLTLLFEFLSAKGDVVTTATQAVPAIQPNGSQPFELKATGERIVAWRYKRT